MTTTASPTKSPPAKKRRAPRRTTPEPTGPVTLELHSEDVAAVRAVAIAASTDEALGPLTRLHVVGDGKTVTIYGTDSYRLHRAILARPDGPVFDALVPAAWLVKALSEVKPPKKAPVVLTFSDTDVTIRNDAETRIAPLSRDKFPDCDGLIEQHNDCNHDPDEEIGVNPKYFVDVMKACDLFGGAGSWLSTATRFKVRDAVKPMRFDVHRGNDRFTGLLMPLRVTAS